MLWELAEALKSVSDVTFCLNSVHVDSQCSDWPTYISFVDKLHAYVHVLTRKDNSVCLHFWVLRLDTVDSCSL